MQDKHAQYIGIEPITSRHISSGAIRRFEEALEEAYAPKCAQSVLTKKYGVDLCDYILSSIDNIEKVLALDCALNLKRDDHKALSNALDVLESLSSE